MPIPHRTLLHIRHSPDFWTNPVAPPDPIDTIWTIRSSSRLRGLSVDGNMSDHAHGPHGPTMPPAVGLPNVKLAIWLFLVSEVMFFAGLIGAYVVLRFGTDGWPDPYDVLAVRLTAFNTFLLICSSVTMVKSFQWSDYGNHNKALVYLALTIVGGTIFVGIQAMEYKHLLSTPSAHMLHHVEAMMEERGIEIPHHHDDEGEHHADASDHVIVHVSTEGATVQEDHEAEVLLMAFERLHEPRMKAKTLEEKREVAEWDRELFDEVIVELAATFPEDKAIRTYGRHHNLYPEGFIPSRDVFTSTFYIMTGFHGAHVSGGVVWLIILFIIYAMGRRTTMGLEVAGLYWHFVDLVWIILFTIVYLM